MEHSLETCTDLGEPTSLVDFVRGEKLDDRSICKAISENDYPIFVRLAGKLKETTPCIKPGEGVPSEVYDYEHCAGTINAGPRSYYPLPSLLRDVILKSFEPVIVRKFPNLPLPASQYKRWLTLTGRPDIATLSPDRVGHVWPGSPLEVTVEDLYIFRVDAELAKDEVCGRGLAPSSYVGEGVVCLDERPWERGHAESRVGRFKRAIVGMSVNDPELLLSSGGGLKNNKQLFATVHTYWKFPDHELLDSSEASPSRKTGLPELLQMLRENIQAAKTATDGVDLSRLKEVMRTTLALTVEEWSIALKA